jgi:hypothetical protein
MKKVIVTATTPMGVIVTDEIDYETALSIKNVLGLESMKSISVEVDGVLTVIPGPLANQSVFKFRFFQDAE